MQVTILFFIVRVCENIGEKGWKALEETRKQDIRSGFNAVYNLRVSFFLGNV